MKDLFPGYYPPTEEEFAVLWQEADFAFDANILLHLYRFSAPTRERLLLILERLGDRVWVPHQAALEFHRNRLDVIRQAGTLYADVRAALRKVDEVVRKHRIHPFREQVEAALQPAVARVGKVLETVEAGHPDLLSHDPFLDQITRLLQGKVGSPYEGDDLKKRLQSARTRTEADVAPGFVDARQKKGAPDEERFGDVILWFQALDHARESGKPLILVTDDNKEDWWRRHEGRTLGPRPELVDEFHHATQGKAFYLYTSERFLEESARSLGLDPLPTTVREARHVREDLMEYSLALATGEQRKMFKAAHAMAEQASCLSHLKQLGLAARTAAAGGRPFPSAEAWCDVLEPHFKVPLEEADVAGCPSLPLSYGYAMNRNMGGVDLRQLSHPQRCVLFFDCDAGERNAVGDQADLPFPPRHIEGNAICFADGHVKVVPQDEQDRLIWNPTAD